MKSILKSHHYWPFALILALHIGLQWWHLRLDFWNDELYTLERFVCQPFGTAAIDYRSTNNHVLFSLLAKCWAFCCGLDSYADAVMHPIVLRLLPLAFSSMAIFWTYKLGYAIASRLGGVMAGLILITTIPFWNYGAQMRGYGLSMCLFAALCNAIYVAINRRPPLVPIALLSCALLYTLPSNIYFLIAISFCLIIWAALKQGETRQRALQIMSSVIAGALLGALLYWPLLPQMRQLPIFASGTAGKSFEALRERLPVVAYHFLSARYLLILPVFVFLIVLRHERWRWLFGVAVIFLLPFLLADVRGNSTPYRVFLTGLPVIAVAIGVAVTKAVALLRSKWLQYGTTAFIGLYCIVVFCYQVKKTEVAALHDIETGQRSGDLYFQYNLHFFHPCADALTYIRTYAQRNIPLVECCRMDAELLKYLSLAGWDRAAAKQLHLMSALAVSDTIDVLSERPAMLKDSLSHTGFTVTERQLLPGTRPVQIIRLAKQ